MYKFSVPMPYSIADIDKMLNINKQVEKSKITSLYFSLPSTCEFFTGFEQRRNMFLSKTKFSFWKDLISYSIDKGFDFIYCLNSPRPLQIENPNFPKQIEILDKLLEKFTILKVNKLRIANTKLLSYIHNNYPHFYLYGSTANDYKMIQEFQNLKLIHPYIKQIVPSHNVNKNFKLLENIQKIGIEAEIMVNEGCLQGCSNRFEHETTFIDHNIELFTQDNLLGEGYCKYNCSKLEHENPILYLVKGNHIYPWEIEEYGKIGIKNFKLNGRDSIRENIKLNNRILNNVKIYLQGIDNINNIENIPVIDFVSNSTLKNILKDLTVKELKQYLPQIGHFVKYGHKCASICGYECKYCYKCAKKIQKIFYKYELLKKRRTSPICVINNR